ncbi:hypothetical protein MAM1_0011c01164 [Mucor ambiguus]|uniref:Uncharacterized protein n=1 Tax=Mucor ambiguus TaxID=91626 RepID=A0A0C9M5H1_9FUNG|nr:hypothetical protein MAM1_0011c01164 [Mucor ambiguus]
MSGALHLNTFVLNSLITTEQQRLVPKFCDLPAVRLVSETTKNTHVQVPHAQDGLLYVPLVFGTTKPGQFKRVQALLNIGASMLIVKQDLVDSLALQDDTVPTSASFIVGNGQATMSSAKLSTKIRISNSIFHSEMHEFYIMVKDCNFQVILGLDWIRKHGVSIDFDNKITDIKCRNILACCPIKSAPQDWLLLAVAPVTPLTECASPTPSFHSCDTSFSAEFSSVPSPFVPPSLDPTLYDTRMGSLTFGLNKDLTFSAYSSGLSELSNDSMSLLPSSETMLPMINTMVDTTSSQTLTTTEPTLPPQYQDFAKVFSKIEADKLPPHRSYDHKIPLVPDAVVPYGPMYSMSQLELKTLYDYI